MKNEVFYKNNIHFAKIQIVDFREMNGIIYMRQIIIAKLIM